MLDHYFVMSSWRASRSAIALVSSSNWRCFILIALTFAASCLSFACSLTISRAQRSARIPRSAMALVISSRPRWNRHIPHTHSNEVRGCAASVLVIDGGVLAQDAAVNDSINFVAGFAVLVFVLVEPERKSALEIFLLHFFSSRGNAEKSSEEAMDIMGGIGAVNVAHKGKTFEPLGTASRHSTTTPSTPFFSRKARISWQTSWAVSAEVEPGMTTSHTPGEWRSEEVRTVDEVRMVADLGDAVIT